MNLKALRKKLDLTQEEIANEMGIDRSHYARIEMGKNNLTVAHLKKVHEKHNVNINWLLFNQGDMFNDSLNSTINSAEESADKGADKSAEVTNIEKVLKHDPCNTKDSPVLYTDAIEQLRNQGLKGTKVLIAPEPVMAGSLGNYVNEEDGELEHFYMPFIRSKGVFACFPVEGQSMMGCVNDGSWVIGRLIEQDWEFQSGLVYIIATRSGGTLLKRVKRLNSLNNKVVCYSDNHHYAPFELPSDEIHKLWVVEFVLQKSLPFDSERAGLNLDKFIDSIEQRDIEPN